MIKIKRKILIDIDNTLTDLNYTLRALEQYYELPRKEIEAINDFNLGSAYGIPFDQQSFFWEARELDIVSNSILNVPVYKKIRSLQEPSDTIYIVTARDKALTKETKKWLYKNDVSYDKLYCVGKSKDKLKWSEEMALTFDLVFEDNPNYLKALSDKTYTVGIDYPYNEMVEVNLRLSRERGEPIV